MTSEYMMVKCYNCGRWIAVDWPQGMKRARHYCGNHKCKNAYFRWLASKKRPGIKTVQKTCLYCGVVDEIPTMLNHIQYYACKKQGCQQARVAAARKRNMASVKRCNERHSAIKDPDRNKSTNRICTRCNKRKVTGDYYYCEKCRNQINAISRHFNEDALYCDDGGMDLETFMGGEL